LAQVNIAQPSIADAHDSSCVRLLDKVTLGQVFILVFQFSQISQMLHMLSFIFIMNLIREIWAKPGNIKKRNGFWISSSSRQNITLNFL
jgi:hypothetical protein